MSIKRIVAGVSTVTCAVMMLGGSIAPVYGLTMAELEAQIAALQAQLLQYQAQLATIDGTTTTTPAAYTGIPDGFTFQNALKYGMTSNDVKYLQIILKEEIGAPTYPTTVGATGYFGSITKASVIAFQEKYTSAILSSWGLTKGTGYVGETTRAKLNSLLSTSVTPPPVVPVASDYTIEADCVAAGFFWYSDVCNTLAEGVTPPVVAGDHSVALASTNPAASTLMSSSAYNTMLVFNATAGSTDWNITSITVERFGISIDSMVSGVLVQDKDGLRHGNVYTFSSKKAAISFTSKPITITKGTTQKISILTHLGSTATSGTFGAKVTAISGDPSGLSLVGNTFSLATGASVLGAIDVDVVSLRTTTASVDIGNKDQLLTRFKFTETTSNEDAYLEELSVYNNGSAADGDIANWILKDASGNTLATVAQSNDKYVIFDLTSSPGYLIPNGSSKTLSLYVDLVDGASRTTQAVILNDYDVVVLGKDTGTRILATATGNTVDTAFPIGDIASGSGGYNHITATAGSLTVVLSNTSPTGTVPAGGNEVVFAKFDLKAKGENIEVRRLEFYLVARTAPDNGDSLTTANESDDIFTGTVNLKTSDGASHYALTVANDAPSTTATAYTLSSYFTIPSGTTETISIVGNLRSDLSSADSFRFAIKNVYVKRLTTGDFQTYQATALNANTLTGAAGSLTVVKDASWGNKSIIAGAAKQVGQFVLQTGSSEGVYISTFNIDLSSTTGVNELWMQKGAGTCSETSSTLIGSVDSSVAGANDSFSTGGVFTIPASDSQVVIVCANFDQSTATGTYIADFDASDISGTGAVSGEAVTNAADSTGQTMTVQTAGILTAKNGSNPNAAVLHASETGVKVLDMTFGTLYEPITIDTFRFTVENGATQDRNFSNYTLKHGSATIGSGKSAVSGVITFSGLSETIPYYGSESYSLWIDTSDALTMGSGDKTRAKFASVEALGAWSNSAIMASHDTGYCGAITTEPTSASSVGHYAVGDLVVHGGALKMVTTAANEGTVLTTGLTLDGAVAAFATGEVSKFGSFSQAATTDGTDLSNLAIGDLVVYYDATPANATGIVTAVNDTANTVAINGATAITGLAADNYVEIPGTGELASAGTATSFDVAHALGSLVYYYDAGGTSTFGVVTTAYVADAATIKVNDTTITIADADRIFALDADVSQEVYSAQSTYQYGVGDVVYHYDSGGTSAWAVVTTGIDAGETMASLVTSVATAAASDRIVRVTPGVIASNNMTMHDVEPILTASDTTYTTGISGGMQTIAIYDITAVGGALFVESLAVYLEGSAIAKIDTAANAIEIWEGGERIYQGGDLSGGVAATYTCDLTTPEEIASGQTKTFTVKVTTAASAAWANTDVGKSLRAKIDGTKGQMASGLDWYYASSGPGTAPTASSPASISDSEFPVYGKYSLTY
ncbi:peptidoglycan-binding protein [Patescibacteria group bacterium]|nr:peptidoglycan-binding protein [Patescibacteria group bacterium]MBU4162358.1 peptidoglycan-binding protein [Patescibacteria group bacterium]